jgi:subtilisin family serine protease
MASIDAGLRFLQAQNQDTLDEMVTEGATLMRRTKGKKDPQVRVLAAYSGESMDALRQAGMQISSTAGDVVAGFVPMSKLDDVAAVPGVEVIEQSRPMRRELDASMAETRANLVHTGPPGRRGAGVIVGIIDSGIDWRHASFRRPDGSARVLRLWDQRLTPVAGEASAAGFGYGVEYTNAQINANLTMATPPVPVRHADGGGHGSHVAGIAAGDGSAAGPASAGGVVRPAFTFVGMAPEADLIIVANTIGATGLGDSANTLDAANYIFAQAAALGRPCVINLSQGDYLGPHDGTSLLERGIDNLLATRGRAFVKSAGNALQDAAHAQGTVGAGATLSMPMLVGGGDTTDNIVDIWYSGADRIGLSILAPGAAASVTVSPGTTTTLTLSNGNRVFVDSTTSNPFNGDNRIFLRLQRGTAAAIAAGTWTIRLHGQTIAAGGRVHAWIQRNHGPQFLPPTVSQEATISIPGTGRRIITVGSYITKGAGVGDSSSFSSRGPTRDGRLKPELCAPGQSITSANAGGGAAAPYVGMSGTSMAAPHVTGAIALMLQRRPLATVTQIRNCLTRTARKDAFTGPASSQEWGHGKLDAKAANDCIGMGLATLKPSDDPATLKVTDDPMTLKAVDDPATLKTVDDPVTLKFSDDGPTLKAIDDPTTLKAVDDPTTLKAVDDGHTLKLADDGVTTGPGGDFQPPKGVGDLGNPGPLVRPTRRSAPSGEALAPFILATPHHTNAWADSFPGAHRQAMAQLHAVAQQVEHAIAQHEAALQGDDEGADADIHNALQSLYADRQRLAAELSQMGEAE